MIDLFKDLQFDEEKHIYTLKGRRLNSVSAEVAKFYKKFDSDAISSAIARSKSSNREEYIKIKEGLLSQWNSTSKEAAELGSLVHKFAEDYLGSSRKVLPKSDYEQTIVNFWNTMDSCEVIGIELRMYLEELNLGGTLDLLLKKDDKYEIWDYKTNVDLFKNYKGQKMFKPFDDLLDTPYSHYILQQNYYKLMLEHKGISIYDMNLVSIRPEGFQVINVPDITDKLITHYENLGINFNFQNSYKGEN